MTDRDRRNVNESETARRLARNKRLVIMVAALAGIIAGLMIVPYLMR